MVIDMEAIHVLFFCNVATHRRLVAEQVPVMNIAIFALYGLVMNPTPP